MEANGAEKSENKPADGDGGKSEEKVSPPSSSSLPADNAGDSASAPTETIVEQMKHAVGNVVGGITDRLSSVLHLGGQAAEKETPSSAAVSETAVRSADADTPAMKVQLAEPENGKSGEATQAKESVRPPSSSNDLLEPDSHESVGRSVSSSHERTATEEEILSNIAHVEDWAEESASEVEEEPADEEEEDLSDDEEAKSVDHDRDRRNPQFIPRNGAYFLHDDRLQTDEEDEADDDESENEGTEKAAGTADKGQGQAALEGATGDANKKSKSKKSPPKKAAAASDTAVVGSGKKMKKDREADAAEKPPVEEKWGHDLYDEATQASKSQDEITDRYGYNIRDDEQAPRGKRPRRYARPPEMRGRGTRGFRGARRGGRGGGATAQEAGGDEEVVVEKENYDAAAGAVEEEAKTPVPPREKSAKAPPGGRGGARGSSRGAAARGGEAGRGGSASSRRPLQQGSGASGYEEENYQPPQRRRNDEAPPPTRTRGPAGPPAARQPPRQQQQQQYHDQQYDDTPQRPYQPRQQQSRYPPPRSQQRYNENEYDDSYGGDGAASVPHGGEFHSRVFFSSRGRGGPSPGAPRRPTFRAPTFQTRPPAVNTNEQQQQRPQPRMPLVPPARNPDVKASGISAGRPVAPPATSSAVPPVQSKRYSERRGQNIRAETSDDVRSSGGAGGGAGGGGGYGYQQSYGRGGGGGGSGSGGYPMGYPSGGATVNYGALHPPGAVAPPVSQQQYGQYYSGGSGSGGHYYDQQQQQHHAGGGGSHQAGYYQGGGYSGPAQGYYQ
ncbi:hypothetical protein BV898_06540 [Hypsibius exemplaris]|uniref:Protein CASC3 n=1 Tax=Hypsibius exemplaris TaxID=2072580 RepID=A0A1W0WW67_HYPEX|nr:hypothetical protein BV898_06540 [Hypsibius exemplaris]